MFIFNPEHDQALANFSSNYTPPTSALKMAHDLAVLPIWYSKNQAVIAEGGVNREFLKTVKEILPLSAILITYDEIALRQNIDLLPQEEIIPWGWNPALRKKLLSYGAHATQLPSIEALQTLRDYSNRKHAVQLLKELKSENSNFCGESYYFKEIGSLLSYLHSTLENKVLKMPVSGSGKGLIWILGEITDKQTDWCKRVIKVQGGIVAEPVLDKTQDFAIEFYLDNGVADFIGYSLFSSATSGAYVGNDLISDEKIENRLSIQIPLELLMQLRELLQIKLAALFPYYKGYAGVDMMICKTNEGYQVQPCVEINMRMNMGVVARLFHNQFLIPEGEGRFVVEYFKKPENAVKFHKKLQQESPLKVNNGKIISGYLSLTPVTADTHYSVYAIVK